MQLLEIDFTSYTFVLQNIPLKLYAEKASLRQAVKDSTLASVSYTVFIPALT